MAENTFKSAAETLFEGMDAILSTKTVVGDAITIGDTILLPLVDVSFGVAAGAFNADKKQKGAGGLTGKMTPSAVLVIKDGNIKLVNIKNQDVMTKILDMVPDIVAKAKKKDPKVTEEEVNDMLDKASEVKPEEKE